MPIRFGRLNARPAKLALGDSPLFAPWGGQSWPQPPVRRPEPAEKPAAGRIGRPTVQKVCGITLPACPTVVCIVAFVALISTAGAQDWPSFRGPAASGVADHQNLPISWDAARGTHIKWTAAIPGLAHSSPIVWRDLVFVTTAISSRPDASFKRGLYGEGDASDDVTPQQWKLICLDRQSGKTLWERTAYEGVPKEKRHMKATYANSTPATDGKVAIAFFGSQGLYAYDMAGKLLWKRDLGRLNVGAYDLPEYEWGTASSPIVYDGKVIVQCDQQKGSFLEAFDRDTGRTLWRTERDELPSWGTPAIYQGRGPNW